MTGMELIEMIRAGKASPPSGIATLGLDRTHRWDLTVSPGQASFRWAVDERYLNLDDAVICSWLVALADQALFFAGTSLCADGESTRMDQISLRCFEDVKDGDVEFSARIDRRAGDRLFGTCDIAVGGALKAQVTATLDVRR